MYKSLSFWNKKKQKTNFDEKKQKKFIYIIYIISFFTSNNFNIFKFIFNLPFKGTE